MPPATTEYCLSALILSGTELPQKREVGIQNSIAQANQKMQVVVTCGRFGLQTTQSACNNGVSEWYQMKSTEDERMAYPSRTDQIPDVFVHLYRGKTVNDVGNPLLPVAFWRISAEELLKQGFNVERPQWITLVEDKSIDQVKDRQFPGNLLIMLAMGKKEDWEECTEGKMTHREKWQKMTEDAQSAVNYQLRVHLYQARDIPDADFFGGGVDPYFKVKQNHL